MSRTIRRKNDPVPRWVKLDSFLKKTPEGFWNWYEIPYEGKALAKALARHHSDMGYGPYWSSGPSKWFRSREERSQRMKNRCQLDRFKKNPEYEVMAIAKKKLPYWD